MARGFGYVGIVASSRFGLIPISRGSGRRFSEARRAAKAIIPALSVVSAGGVV